MGELLDMSRHQTHLVGLEKGKCTLGQASAVVIPHRAGVICQLSRMRGTAPDDRNPFLVVVAQSIFGLTKFG